MTRHTRLTVFLVVSLALAVTGAVPLITTQPIFALLTLLGGFGVGAMAMAILLAPRASRIRRPPAERTTSSRPAARRKSGARRPQGGKPAGKKKSRTRGGGDNNHRSDTPADGPKLAGTVKWFSDKKGFGFITPENGEEDCFVHRSAVQGNGSLNEGNRVEFQIVSDDKGRRAAANVVSLS